MKIYLPIFIRGYYSYLRMACSMSLMIFKSLLEHCFKRLIVLRRSFESSEVSKTTLSKDIPRTVIIFMSNGTEGMRCSDSICLRCVTEIQIFSARVSWVMSDFKRAFLIALPILPFSMLKPP